MNRILKVAAALSFTLLMAARCGGEYTPNPVTPKTLYELRLAYDTAFLVPATNYRRLGLCPGASRATVAYPCAERAIVRKLQTADRGAQIAFDNLQAFTLANPTLDPGAYIDAARRAINTATQVLAQTRLQ